jgi:hypothetical protein
MWLPKALYQAKRIESIPEAAAKSFPGRKSLKGMRGSGDGVAALGLEIFLGFVDGWHAFK